MDERKIATDATRAAHAALAASLPPESDAEFVNAGRGFIGTIPDAAIDGAWSMAPYAFLQGERPDTVNPSLWRQARLNSLHGLFEVTPGVYQVRGFDISNITFVEGKRGLIVIDPLTSAAPAAAALRLMRAHRGEKPVTAVIYTHSHVDHYGGVRGVLSEADIAAGVPIVAPEGFLEAAISENVLLGNVMNRRATYMYGALLPRDPQGHVDSGLGKAVSFGQVALVAPNLSIRETGETHVIDGVEICFQVTPDTEAPAEMNFFFPRHGAWRRTAPAICTTSTRPAARRCATPAPGVGTSTRRAYSSPETPRPCSPATTGPGGGRTRRRGSSPSSATSTNTFTTRLCAWPITAWGRWKSPSN